GVAVWLLGHDRAAAAAAAALASLLVAGTQVALAQYERGRWIAALRRIEGQVDAMAVHPAGAIEFAGPPELGGLVRSLARLSDASARRAKAAPAATPTPMTRSGLYESSLDMLVG